MRNLVLIIVLMTFLNLALAANDNIRAAQLASVAAQYLDGICSEVVTQLETQASSPEALSGEWKAIKPGLAALNSIHPGTYFYMLHNGNYYSAEKDFTNLNLCDRDYFLPLMEGNTIKGFPVYSRSTGIKSAVFAAPIIKDEAVTGALGASIYLEELRIMLNDHYKFDDNTTWFVIDQMGNTILDKDPDFIFMNVLTQGTQSVKDAMSTVLVGESGTAQYQLGGTTRLAQYQKLKTVDWWLVVANKQGKAAKPTPKMEITLRHFTPQLQKKLNQIDKFTLKLLKNKNYKWDTEANIRTSLEVVIEAFPDVVEASFVDLKGILRYIEPREYKNFEGTDISMQDHVIALRKKHIPTFSSGFMSVEGFLAVDLAYPLYNQDKEFIGSLSLLINPSILVKPILNEISFADGYEPWFMQTDGMMIYDPDKEELGKMLFTDPIYRDYENLQELGRHISAERKGNGVYVYQAMGHQEKVIKSCSWDTVSLYGREWRIVLAHREK